MAKVKSYTTLLVISLVIPLLGTSFVMTILNLILQKAFALSNLDPVMQNVNMYLPLALFLVGLAFAIVALVGAKKDPKVLPVTALVLNSILVVTGILNVVFTYLSA